MALKQWWGVNVTLLLCCRVASHVVVLSSLPCLIQTDECSWWVWCGCLWLLVVVMGCGRLFVVACGRDGLWQVICGQLWSTVVGFGPRKLFSPKIIKISSCNKHL